VSTLTPSPDKHRRDAFEWSFGFERFFDFSKFPNIQIVTLRFWVRSRKSGLPWIPMSLSTLKPATSPRLSLVILDFSTFNRPVESMIEDTGNDLLRIADEAARIEREFEGAVNIAVFRDPRYAMALDTLDVRFGFVGWKRPCAGHVDSSSTVPCRSFSATFRDMRRLSPSSTPFGRWSCGIRSFNHACYYLDADFSYRVLYCM